MSRAGRRASCESGSASDRSAGEVSTAELQALQQLEELLRRAHDQVGALAELGRAFGRDDRDPHRRLQPVERGEAVEIGRVVAGVERALSVRSPRAGGARRFPSSRRPAGAPRAPSAPNAAAGRRPPPPLRPSRARSSPRSRPVRAGSGRRPSAALPPARATATRAQTHERDRPTSAAAGSSSRPCWPT